jgi:amino acid adenylation domain-containing protein
MTSSLPPDLAEALRARLLGPPEASPPPSPSPVSLSSTQRQIWFMDRWAGPASHTVSLALRLTGPLDRPALRHAVRAVVARHDTLRTVVTDRDGVPTATLSTVEVPVVEGGEVNTLAARPLDSPLRVHLIETGPDEHILLLLVHHIACDAKSLGLLVADLERAYRGETLPPLPHQYWDVVAQHRERAGAIDYWRSQLADAPIVLDLSCAAPRPPQPGFRGRRHEIPLSPGILDAAARFGRTHGATLSMVLLAAWISVLRRHSGQDDIVVGTAADLRDSAGAEQVIGPLVNLVPVRVRVGPIASTTDVLAAVREAVLGALDHASVAFERIVETVQPVRSSRHHPVCQVTFDLRTEFPSPSRFAGLRAEPVPVDVVAARFDLALSVDGTPTGWHARLVTAVDLYTVDIGDQLLRDFQTALHNLLTLPKSVIHHPAAPPHRSFLQSVDEWTAHRPDAVAVEDGHQRLTYRELDRRSRGLAGHLAQLGVTTEVPVGVALNRGADLLVALLGVLRAGGAYVPLDPEQPQARTDMMIADSGARIVVSQGDTNLSSTVDITVRPANLAYIIYTSGSTGRPKGVEVTHANLASVLDAMGKLIGAGPDDRWLAVTTITFDIAALELFLPLMFGGRVVIAPPGAVADPDRLRELIARYEITILQATPVTWRALGPMSGLSVALCGGERLTADLARQVAASADKAWNVYGPTETTIWSTAHRLDPGMSEPVPLGTPLPGTLARVLDRQLRPVPPGDPGELCLSGLGVARGYRGLAGLTAERFAPDAYGERLYRTGDRVRSRPDGTLEFLGRLDDQVKIRGLRVEPGEIESVARGLPVSSTPW